MAARSKRKRPEKSGGRDVGFSSVPKRSPKESYARTPALILAFLIVATLVVYWGALGNRFVFDDEDYVLNNHHIEGGISLKSLAWAFKLGYACNWHPLTWISHSLDVSLFGLKPPGHHFTSLLLHAANVVLLFLVFNVMTGRPWRSLFVTALFALHPVHVESVAWVSERKDVLSGFFWLLAMWAYVRYTEKRELRRYALVLFAMALGLMAKPMVVTLPLVLLLLDYWPLERLQPRSGRPPGRPGLGRDGTRPLLEKWPLLALSAGSSVMTLLAQHKGGAISTFRTVPFALRLENAAVAYINYIGKTIWPTGLAAHYPYPRSFLVWEVAVSVAALLALTIIAVRIRRSHPYVLVGWLWFLVTLIPVIGLVQVGGQSFADRYTYIPLIGLFVIVAWGVPDLAARFAQNRRQVFREPSSRNTNALAAAAVGVCLVLSVLTANQVHVWKDGITLWKHAIAVTRNNYRAHYNLGALLQELDRNEEAIPHYIAAIKGEPEMEDAYYNLARCLELRGDAREAIHYYRAALRIKPDDAQAHNNLACILGKMGRTDDVIYHCSLAVKFKPNYAEAHRNLALAFYVKHRYEDALREARRCVECKGILPPGFIEEIERRIARERQR